MPRLLSTSSHFTNVLGVSHHDSLATIKSTFRALAKKYHPDLGHPDASEAKIAEILSAYQDACDEFDEGGMVGSSKISTEAEIFTVQELAEMRGFDVREFKVILEEAIKLPQPVTPSTSSSPTPSSPSSSPPSSSTSLSTKTIPTVTISLYDSVSDLKRALQITYADQWGIASRKRDRDGLNVGWEIVHNGRALSYHLFLNDYNVNHGDELHVVIEATDSSVSSAADKAADKAWRRRKRELKQKPNS